MAYAVGSYANALCDRCGFQYPYRSLQTEWNGLKVCPECFENKHPQLEPNIPPADPEALFQPRIDRTEPATARLLTPNPFLSGGIGSNVITVNERSHGRATSDVVRFRDVEGFDGFSKAVLENASGYTITVTGTDTYTFTASSGTATFGGVKGGGENSSAGPVTLSP